MAAEGLYTLINVYAQGKLLAEEVSVTIRRDTKAIEVETVVKGLGGLSPGAARIMMDVESAVPFAAFELNPGMFWSNNGTPQIITWQLFAASSQLTTKGWIQNDDLTHGVNARTALKFSIIAQYADWVTL